MKIRNKLQEMLQDLGIKTMVPTEDLLKKRLGGMTIHRFNQILRNDSKNELSVVEVDNLQSWLGSLTGKPKEQVNLLDAPQKKPQLV